MVFGGECCGVRGGIVEIVKCCGNVWIVGNVYVGDWVIIVDWFVNCCSDIG